MLVFAFEPRSITLPPGYRVGHFAATPGSHAMHAMHAMRQGPPPMAMSMSGSVKASVQLMQAVHAVSRAVHADIDDTHANAVSEHGLQRPPELQWKLFSDDHPHIHHEFWPSVNL